LALLLFYKATCLDACGSATSLRCCAAAAAAALLLLLLLLLLQGDGLLSEQA
jgi:hypothetical protein